MNQRISGLHHLAVQVTDLAAAESFYVGVLGLPVKQRWFEPNGSPRSLWLETGGGAFLAVERSAAQAVPVGRDRPFRDGHAGWHLPALRIAANDRPAWEAHLAAAGVTVEHRSAYSLYFRDPDGNRLALSHHPDPADAVLVTT